MQCIKDPEMCWYVRSAYFTYLEIIKHAYTLKFATFFEVHKAIIVVAPYKIDIDWYDDIVVNDSSYQSISIL